jgi:BlaI family transcriptional regulator, penicillinase repressor
MGRLIYRPPALLRSSLSRFQIHAWILLAENRQQSIFVSMPRRKRPTEIPSPLETLPAAELDVLTFLWRHGPAMASEIRRAIAPFRPMAHGSAVTLLKRLEEKRLVAATSKQGKAFIYSATPKPESTYRRLVGNMLERVFGGNAFSLVSSLFADRPPNPDEVVQLRELLNQLVASSEGNRNAAATPSASTNKGRVKKEA